MGIPTQIHKVKASKTQLFWFQSFRFFGSRRIDISPRISTSLLPVSAKKKTQHIAPKLPGGVCCWERQSEFIQNQKPSWNRLNHKLQTSELVESTQNSTPWNMVPLKTLLLTKVNQNQKPSWNRSNHKLQTWELVESTQTFVAWNMVPLKTLLQTKIG